MSATDSKNAIRALVLPLVTLVIGGLWVFSRPLESSDWLGMGYVIGSGLVVGVASGIAVAFAILSFLRNEPNAGLSLLSAAPGVLFLAAVCVWVAENVHRDHQRQDLETFVEQLAQDSELRRESAAMDPLDTRTTRALLSAKVGDLLTPEQVRRIWHQRKDIEGGNHYERLISPAYTPPDVLREYFERHMAGEMKRTGTRSFRGLSLHPTLLLHRNLPDDIIQELRADGDSGVTGYLERNPKLTSSPAYLRRWENVPPQPAEKSP